MATALTQSNPEPSTTAALWRSVTHFDKGKIKGNQISFVTKPVHGTWYEFEGHIGRGPAKTQKEEGYWVLTGTLKEYSTDVERKVTARARRVNFKSFPQDDDTGDEEQVPPDKK